MKTLYLDCGMGAAGDMLSAALYELLDEEGRASFLRQMAAAGIPGVAVSAERSAKCGIVGTHFKVAVGGEEEGECRGRPRHDGQGHCHEHEHDHEHDSEHGHAQSADHHGRPHECCHSHGHEREHCHEHERGNGREHPHCHEHGECRGHHHHHSGMAEIERIIGALALPDAVRRDAVCVYKLIAEAESDAHGVAVADIHFHEVGAMDAIADITAFCLLADILGAERVVASPVRVGYGHVRCAHGILPVPAPATAFILRGVPVYAGEIKGELCTPTGAALLKRFAAAFEEMPLMRVERIGYGMGRKDFPAANCVRAMLGEIESGKERVVELSCNIDDMTPEQLGFAQERLFQAGALEVYTIPAGMKKSRPGVVLCVMCGEESRQDMVRAMFKHTTTIGIRESESRRYALQRRIECASTPLGEVRVKRSEGFGVVREKYEYDDIARIAREKDLSIGEVLRSLKQ